MTTRIVELRQGILKKNEREYMLDGNWVTNVSLTGTSAWVQFELAGGAAPFAIDRVEVDGMVRSPSGEPECSEVNLSFFVIASQRVGARRRSMTGLAKQPRATSKSWIASSQALLAMTVSTFHF